MLARIADSWMGVVGIVVTLVVAAHLEVTGGENTLGGGAAVGVIVYGVLWQADHTLRRRRLLREIEASRQARARMSVEDSPVVRGT